jgi:hypothetical protein
MFNTQRSNNEHPGIKKVFQNKLKDLKRIDWNRAFILLFWFLLMQQLPWKAHRLLFLQLF